MLDTFKARLKAITKAAGVNLSKKRLDAMAAKLHAKFPDITEEAEHDTHINDVYDVDIFKEIKALDDYQRTQEAQSASEPEENKQQQPAQEKPKPKSEMEELKELVKGLTTTVQTLTQERQTQTMQQKLAANEKLKGIDAKLYSKWQLPKTDEEIDAFADEVVATYGHLVTKEQPGEAGGQQTGAFVPGQQRQTISTASKKVDPDIIAFAKSKNEQAKTTTKA